MKNNDLRAEIMKQGLYAYQVAEVMNIKPNTLSHYFMSDLSMPRRERIINAITIAKQREVDNGTKTKK